jgi:hypothetical protein
MGGKGTVGHLFVLGVSKVITTLIGKEFELMVGRNRVRRNGRPVPVSRWEEGHLNPSHRPFAPGNMIDSRLKGCYKGIVILR